MPYLLIDLLQTRKAGEPVYFEKMTRIGPALTRNFSIAEKFPSEQEARRHPAYSFAWTSLEAVEADEEQIWDTITAP